MTHPHTQGENSSFALLINKTHDTVATVFTQWSGTHFTLVFFNTLIHCDVRNASWTLQGFTRIYRRAVENLNSTTSLSFLNKSCHPRGVCIEISAEGNTGTWLQCLQRREDEIYARQREKWESKTKDCAIKSYYIGKRLRAEWEHDHLLQRTTCERNTGHFVIFCHNCESQVKTSQLECHIFIFLCTVQTKTNVKKLVS